MDINISRCDVTKDKDTCFDKAIVECGIVCTLDNDAGFDMEIYAVSGDHESSFRRSLMIAYLMEGLSLCGCVLFLKLVQPPSDLTIALKMACIFALMLTNALCSHNQHITVTSIDTP